MAWHLHFFSLLNDSLQGLLSRLFAARPSVRAVDAFLFPRSSVSSCINSRNSCITPQARLLEVHHHRAKSNHFGRHDDEGRPNLRRKTFDAAGFEQHRRASEPYVPRVILDSGASRHVVGDVTLLSSFLTIAPAGTDAAAAYQARDGRLLAVAGLGTISVGNFNLPDVLYVPDLCTQVILVSVPQLAQKGYLVMFGGGQCHVKDQSSNRIVGRGRLHNDDSLYHLEFLDVRHYAVDAVDTYHGSSDP